MSVCTETGVHLLVWSSWRVTATKASVSLQTTRAERVQSWWVLLYLSFVAEAILGDVKSHRVGNRDAVHSIILYLYFLMSFCAGEQSICLPSLLLGTPSPTGTGTSFGFMSVMSFHIKSLFYFNVQIRIEGTVERIPYQSSCEYFHSRPKSSQIGAVVSRQSTPVPSRDVRTRTMLCIVDFSYNTEGSVLTVWFLLVFNEKKCRTRGEIQGQRGANAWLLVRMTFYSLH